MDIDNLRELLIKNGYKVTKQREIIFEALKENSGSHLSPEELHDIVIKKDSDIGIATVYRTLQLLDELKVVYKINFNDNRYRYEISSEDETHHHHHLICTNCNKVIEVKRDLLEHAESIISNEYNFQIKDHSLKFYGICSDCQKEMRKNDRKNKS
ncbi:MAG: transcriptional repressor [Tissierellia bacterium]|nr:transcriptional repressor [Tissierellia bacterium]